MKTKRLFTALMIATMMSCGIILAQPGQKEKKLTPEQRLEMQVKKAQKRLFLDEETAAKFAPLYKEYLEAMKQCKPAPKQLQKGEKKELTDAEIDQMMQDRFAARKKLVETQETYYKKFKKILNIRQVEVLFKDNGPKRPHRPCINKPQCPQGPKAKMGKAPAPCKQCPASQK